MKAAASAADQNAINAAVEAERKRQQEIDEIAVAVNDPDLVRKQNTAKSLYSSGSGFQSYAEAVKTGDQHLAKC